MKNIILIIGVLGMVMLASPADAALSQAHCENGQTVNYDPAAATATQACAAVGSTVAYCPPGAPTGVNTSIPCSPSTASGLLGILNKVFTTMFIFLVTIASFTLLYAAFLYVTSEGEQEKINQAKKIIIYAVIALIVAALALGAPAAIQQFIIN